MRARKPLRFIAVSLVSLYCVNAWSEVPCPLPKREASPAEASSAPVRNVVRRSMTKTDDTFVDLSVDRPARPANVPDPPKVVRLPTGVPNAEVEVAIGEARRQFYTEWQYDAERDRLYCYYYFRPDPRFAAYKKQLVVHYHDSPAQPKEFTYFYSFEKAKYWGRCTSKYHPRHDPDLMQWHFNKNGAWDAELTPGSPAIPGSGDGAGIINPPDPPV